MSNIEKVLLDATGQKPQKKGEDRQKYLLRLALAVNDKLSDKEWDALEAHDGAQEWVTAAVKADNDDKDLEDFPDLPDAEDEDGAETEAEAEEGESEDEAAEEAEEEEVATKPNKAGKGAGAKTKTTTAAKKPAAAAKKDAKPAAEKSGGKTKDAPSKKPAGKSSGGAPKTISMRRALKQIIVKNPKLSTDDLIDRLVKKGYDSPSKVTVTTVRADTRDTMKVMNEAGLAEVELG